MSTYRVAREIRFISVPAAVVLIVVLLFQSIDALTIHLSHVCLLKKAALIVLPAFCSMLILTDGFDEVVLHDDTVCINDHYHSDCFEILKIQDVRCSVENSYLGIVLILENGKKKYIPPLENMTQFVEELTEKKVRLMRSHS